MEENGYIVYKHTNKINGKVYIGITHYKNPEIRWNKGKNYKCSKRFYNAILKYGWDMFDHEVLFAGLSKEEACDMERILIAKYKREGISYNIAEGGEGGLSVSQETREKLSKSLKGKKKKNPEAYKRAAEKRKAEGKYTKNPSWLWEKRRSFAGENNPMYGKKHTEEALAKKYKAVIQFSKDGEYMAEYKSIKEAAETVGISRTHLVSALKGRSKSAAGYIWRYKDE